MTPQRTCGDTALSSGAVNDVAHLALLWNCARLGLLKEGELGYNRGGRGKPYESCGDLRKPA